jgi:hypothetical protein
MPHTLVANIAKQHENQMQQRKHKQQPHEIANQPASQPANQSASQPASQPASKITNSNHKNAPIQSSEYVVADISKIFMFPCHFLCFFIGPKYDIL